MNVLKRYIFVISAVFLVLPNAVFAQSLQEQINTLNAQIKQNQEAANGKHAEANTLQATIAELNESITSAQTALNLTSLQITQTNTEIDAQNKELDHQKTILKDNLRIVYRQGETTPIELIASSKNLSDFVAQQQYLAAIKKKIDANLIKIAAINMELHLFHFKNLKDFVNIFRLMPGNFKKINGI